MAVVTIISGGLQALLALKNLEKKYTFFSCRQGLYYERLPSIFFGCMAFVAGMLVLTVPETINTRLPDTLEEAEGLSKSPKKVQQA
ncbi:Solute carrier family 22 member 6-A [Eumeta japonica]|uniref:Solute carrier family 22 member 6-A n=1 Tax=Eumeta variegata TaxID=151549 RepID=A0A4C1ZB99_EUMVA|nr:Solute carrier family 22 member 6-A [Eumeta japonica]